MTGVNVSVTCTMNDGSAFSDGTTVPISLVGEYRLATCAPQYTGAVLQLATVRINSACCKAANAYAFAGKSTCVQARLPSDTRCVNRQASSWQAFNRGPQASVVLRSGLGASCSTTGGQEVGSVLTTCENSRLMRFNLTTPGAPSSQAVWLAVGCKAPTSLPAPGTTSRAVTAAGCNRFRRLPDNDKIVNAFQLSIKPGSTSFVWRLTETACNCSSLWWAVHTSGLYPSTC